MMENIEALLMQLTKSKFSENGYYFEAYRMSKYMKFRFICFGIKRPLRALLQKKLSMELENQK